MKRRVRIALAFACAAGALLGLAGRGDVPAQTGSAAPTARDAPAGRSLFVEGCSSCHGMDARGIPGRGPSLRGVGAAAADFYLRTGRMPLADPGDEPVRTDEPPYSDEQIRQLVAYVASFGGPPIPAVHADRGDLSEGRELFTENCAGCHQVVGRGGITTRGVAPDLQQSEPVDVAEAVRIGPYLMPHFRHLDGGEVDSLARYVVWTREPDDRGGWGIGHIGPIPEGMVTWLLAAFALVLVIRIIGERSPE